MRPAQPLFKQAKVVGIVWSIQPSNIRHPPLRGE